MALIQDDFTKWKHFPRCFSFVRGIHRTTVDSPHKGQWRGALMLSLISAWTNVWANNRDAGYLRHHCSLWRHCNDRMWSRSWPGCDRSRNDMTTRLIYHHSATGRTKVHYTKGEILRKSSFLQLHYSDAAIKSQICTCPDSSAVVACAKLWLDIILLSGLLQCNT